MARIDKQALLFMAAEAARRSRFVVQDPAVTKSAKQAGKDLAQAARSCSSLCREVRASSVRSA